MKLSTKSAILLKTFDIQLKKMLEEDLRKYRQAEQDKKNMNFLKQLLAAA